MSTSEPSLEIDEEVQRCRILVVETEHPAIEQLRHALDTENDLDVVRNLEHASRMLQYGSYSVLLCSECVMGANGIAFLSQVHRAYPDLQLVLMSEAVDVALLEYAVNQLSILRFLRKPLEFAKLREMVDAARRRYLANREIERLRVAYHRLSGSGTMATSRWREFYRALRLLLHYKRSALLYIACGMLALQTMFVMVSCLALALLYLLKVALGINVFSQFHLADILS